ncbi:MAG: cytochrome c [Candidatus Obscuribacterales bacterium]|nr:cytochrome c [Candidatus Obscuribacterales bacterium]
MNRKGASILVILVLAFSGLEATLADPVKKGSPTSLKGTKRKKMVRPLAKRIKLGSALYEMNGCADCHSIRGNGCLDGEALDGIKDRRTRSFVEEHLVDPEEHVIKNYKVFSTEPNMMPHPNLNKKEIALIIDYLFSLPAQKVKAKQAR